MTLTTSIKSHNVSTYMHILQYIHIINTTTCSMHNDQTSKLEHRAPVQGQHPPLRVGWPLHCLAEQLLQFVIAGGGGRVAPVWHP